VRPLRADTTYTKFCRFFSPALPVVSLATVAFTAYQGYFKGPALKIILSDRIRAWLGTERELTLNLVVTVLNGGARYGVLTRISGHLVVDDQPPGLPIVWRMFVEHKNVGEEGTRFKPHGTFAGWADNLVVPARQAVSKQIQFVSTEAFQPKAGRYHLRLQGYVGDRHLHGAEVNFSMQLDNQTASRLANCLTDPDTRVAKESVTLMRDITI
jgi:hypothetical protein